VESTVALSKNLIDYVKFYRNRLLFLQNSNLSIIFLAQSEV